jgi:hypothetical protein
MNSNILANCRCLWQGAECDLVNDVKVFIVSECVITCDPRKVVFDDQFGEDHVGLNILYCLNNVSVVMIIWKWSLSQTILDGYHKTKLPYQLLMKRAKLVLGINTILFKKGNERYVILKVQYQGLKSF